MPDPSDKFLGPPLTAQYRPTTYGYGMIQSLYTGQIPLFMLAEVEAMRCDPKVQLAMAILRAPLQRLKWKVRCKSSAVGEYVDSTLRRFWERSLGQAATHVEYGNAAGEPQWAEEDGLIRYQCLRDVYARDAVPLVLQGRQVGIQVKGMAQGAMNLYRPRSFWVSHRPRNGSFFGYSRFAGMWWPWLEKRGKKGATDVRRLWYVKNAFRGGIIRHPPGMTEDGNGNLISNQDYARQILEKAETGGIMVFPNAKGPDGGEYLWTYEPAAINGDLSGVREYSQDLDLELIEGAEIPAEVVQAATSGSGWAGRSVPFLVFLTGEDELARELVAAVDFWICRPGVWVNFGPDQVYDIEPQSLVELLSAPEGGQPGQPQQPQAQEAPPTPRPETPERVQLSLDGPDRAAQENASALVDAIIDSGSSAGVLVADEIRARVADLLKKKYTAKQLAPEELIEDVRVILADYEPLLAQSLSDATLAAWLAGGSRATTKLPAATVPEVGTSPALPPRQAPPPPASGIPRESAPVETHLPMIEAAAADLAGRQVLPREAFDQLADEAKAQAFTVAGVQTADALERLRDALSSNVAEGGTLTDFSRAVEAMFAEGGLSRGHIENVYRTNVSQAYTTGLQEVLAHPLVRDEVPYLAYHAVHDSRVRPDHLALERMGLDNTNIYRADDPFWRTYMPPWGYQCRCAAVPMTISDAAAAGVREAREWQASGKPPAVPQWVEPPPFQPPPGWSRRAQLPVQLSYWITIGGHEEGDKKHKGGTRVLLDNDGTIIGGGVPRSLHGKKISRFKELIEHHNKTQKKEADNGRQSPAREKPSERPDSGGRQPAGKQPAQPGPAVAKEAGRPADTAGSEGRPHAGQPARREAPRRIPRTVEQVNQHLDRYEQHFRSRIRNPDDPNDPMAKVAGWMGMLREHIGSVGVDAALAALGPEVAGQGEEVEYGGHMDVSHFAEEYLARVGISLLGAEPAADKRLVSAVSATSDEEGVHSRGDARDYIPVLQGFKSKLEEAKHLPGLESTEDLGKLMGGEFGSKVSHFTADVVKKLDETYGEGKWIVRPYTDEAYGGYGIFFPDRVKQIKKDAQQVIWDSGENLARYGFEHIRQSPTGGFGDALRQLGDLTLPEPEDTEPDNRGQYRPRDYSSLVLGRAKQAGLMRDSHDFDHIRQGNNVGGFEHDVYFDPKSDQYWKISKGGLSGRVKDLPEYLARGAMLNKMFPELGYQLHGIIEENGEPRTVVSVNKITGSRPSQGEVEGWFTSRGWEKTGEHAWGPNDEDLGHWQWKDPRTGTVISDANHTNFIKTADGKLVPIDVDVLPGPGSTEDLKKEEPARVVGIRHQGGEEYRFGTQRYADTIHGDARYWGDRAALMASSENGADIDQWSPKAEEGKAGGGTGENFPTARFMVSPAFPVVGISNEERAQGITFKEGQEGRTHIITRNGKAELVPHSTWLKKEALPVVFENDDSRAMAQAAVDAINALPESERQGQIYAPDIIKTESGYKVVEANPANEAGASGYLQDNPLIMDSYVAAITGREPAHVQFIRNLLSRKQKAIQMALDAEGHQHRGKGPGGGQFTASTSGAAKGEPRGAKSSSKQTTARTGESKPGVADAREQAAARKQAQAKIANAPVPTREQVAKARAELEKAKRGEGRAGGDSRGGSAASRRKQRENLFKEFGGEKKGYIVCHNCGLKCHYKADNEAGLPTFERGKIFVKAQGGGYQLPNLLPECFGCNRSRNDKALRKENLP